MIVSKNHFHFSPEDYLAGEKISPIKHEYRQGKIYAMAGASNPHVLISLNLATLLRNHLRGSGCLVYMADTKVRIQAANVFYYPDVTVTCDRRDTTSVEDFICYPSLIVEVLSPTTAAFDRGNKFSDYQRLESLQEYVLISQDRVGLECYRRSAEGNWDLYAYGEEEEEINLAIVDFRCAIAAIYEDVPGLL